MVENAGEPQGTLPLLPLRSMVLFPGLGQPVDLARATSVAAVRAARQGARGHRRGARILVATQREAMVERPRQHDLQPVAVVAEILQVLQGVPGRVTAIVRGLHRANILEVHEADDFFEASFQRCHDRMGDPTLAYALAGAVQDLARQHDELLPQSAKTKQRAHTLMLIENERAPGAMADLAASHIELESDERVRLLLELHVTERLRQLMELLSHRMNVLRVKRDLDKHVRDHLSRHEHEALLRHKLRAIQSELGRDDDDDGGRTEIHDRLEKKTLSDEARTVAERELARLARMNPSSNEANIARTYLEWLADLPWGTQDATEDRLDIPAARELLERAHHGLFRVKKRIIEYLSVRKLAPGIRGPILCLVGPPGVGKTSLGRSIADALDRRFVRISLGGLRDDAEIRGHRRTYVGAMPGRVIQAMKRAGSTNPVILLDELDKLVAPDLRGDPAGAMLEVLDPEQNDGFEDHYLGLGYDLSRVIFVATANDGSRIPDVLRDRLEIIEVSGYTTTEKVAIARDHLLPRVRKDIGLHANLEIGDEVILALATEHTRESGVRDLQRKIEALLRDVAMGIVEGRGAPERLSLEDVTRILGPPKFHPEVAGGEPPIGVVCGLGWTSSGGRLLFVEAILTDGDGKIRLTGKLGEVMQESGQTAISLVRSMAETLGIPNDFLSHHDIHVHLPQGAVPKDGPSAGVTTTTALVSALTRRRVRTDVAMTGEITLRGRVLAIGGVREKVVAAHRAGIREVILPLANRKDEPNIPEAVLADMQLHYVSEVGQVLEHALADPAPAEAAQ